MSREIKALVRCDVPGCKHTERTFLAELPERWRRLGKWDICDRHRIVILVDGAELENLPAMPERGGVPDIYYGLGQAGEITPPPPRSRRLDPGSPA